MNETTKNHKTSRFSKREFELLKKQRQIKGRKEIEIVYDGPFFAMTPQDLIRDPSVSIPARLTFGVCHTLCPEKTLDGKSNTFASLETLGKLLGRHPTNVSRYLRELHEAGWISILRRGLGMTNIIILHGTKQRR